MVRTMPPLILFHITNCLCLQSGRTISFQLSTSNTDKLANVNQLGDGHYVQKLNPPVPVPFYASPKVALWSLSFSNTFANVDHETFANDDKFLWQVGANAPVTLTISNRISFTALLLWLIKL